MDPVCGMNVDPRKAIEFEYNGNKITVDGAKVAYRPEDRIKKIR